MRLSGEGSTWQAEDSSLDQKTPAKGIGKPLQDFFMETPMDRGVWQATTHGVAKNLIGFSD